MVLRGDAAHTGGVTSSSQIEARIEPALYREVMGHYPTGVAVVTGFDDEQPVGMVVGTFTAVSMDPPLVAFMPQRTSGTYARLARAETLCINVVAADQLELCRTMAGRAEDKFGSVAWAPSEHGAPHLADAVAHVHCRAVQEVDAGDHWIVLCKVLAMEVTRPVTPLLFFQGSYGRFADVPAARLTDEELIDHGWWSYTSDFPM
jgi:flavin reductase (DIM6/NTAB) family NADH-FMN oxidoreductase RutF